MAVNALSEPLGAPQPQRKTGLLGGSFDPVHLTHIALARQALETLGLDGVDLIPAANPWQRAPLAAAPGHRLAMLALAVRKEPALHVNPIEIQRSGPTYTIDTLRALPKGPQYVWILGSDQLERFCSWHQWETLLEYVELAVAARPGSAVQPPAAVQRQLEHLGKPLHTLPLPPSTVSATTIRERLGRGESTQGLLDEAVAAYIQAHGLYGSHKTHHFKNTHPLKT